MFRNAVSKSLVVAMVLAAPTWVSAQTLQFAGHKDYAAGYGPASIAVGDINGDSVMDLAVANNFDGTVAVLVGTGDGSFQPPRSTFLGPNNNPRSVAIGDLNRDGRPDLALASPGANSVFLLTGNGDATFAAAVALPVGTGPSSVVASDFNADGNIDLATANGGSNDVSVLLGNGNGTFQAVRTFAADGGPAFVAVGDFNRDTRTDLAVANTASGTVSVLLGGGDGTFQAPRTFIAGSAVWSVAVGDVNGDGMQDLATANNGTNSVSVLLGNGDGNFQPAQSTTVGVNPASVAVADFNGDGRADLAVASAGVSSISLLIGNGNGTFQAARVFPGGYESWAVAAGDFNRDSRPDLAIANTFSTTVSVLLGSGDGTFPATPNYRVGLNPESIAADDFNRDTRLDMAVANAGSNTVSVLLGNGDGTFQTALTFAAGAGPTSVTTGDFNRDGNLDSVTSNYGSNNYYTDIVATTVSVLLGNGDGTFRTPQAFEAGSGPNDVAVGDFNGDTIQDLAVANYGPNTQRAATVSVLLGNSDGTFRAPQAYPAGDGPTSVAIGDFNRDGMQDLAAGNYRSNNVTVLLGNGNGTFQAAGAHPVGSAPWQVVAGDFDGDLITDLAVTGHFSDIVSLLKGNGDGSFRPHVWIFTGRNPTGLASADANGDGRLDLMAVNYFATTVSVFVSNGNLTFQAAQNFAAGLAPMCVTAGDFNGDGQSDLAVANYFEGTVSVLINRTTATSQAATPTFNPPAGTYTQPQSVTLSTTTSGATIRYTTDGSAPTTSSSVYSGPIAVSQTTTIRAMAVAAGMTNSGIGSAAYTIVQQAAAAPTFNPPAGTYTQPQSVTLSTTTSGATIHYTTNGTAPTTSSPTYSGPIPVSQTMTIRALAAASGMANSDVASATYTIQPRVATPAFSPAGGTFVGSVTVTLSTTTSGATIHYTTNGTAPTTSSPTYSAPIPVSQTTTIRALAAASGMVNSDVASATYTIQPRVATPAFSPAGGTFVGSVTVTLSTTTSGATIHYTTNGTAPTTSSPTYSGPIPVSQTTMIRALAAASGMANSDVASATYTIQQRVATPTFSPAGGTYVGSVSVAIGTSTSGATIRYTLDGSTPNGSSSIYTGPVTVTRTTTIRAMAAASGMIDSDVSSAVYTVRAVPPTFSVPAGTYNQPRTVALSTVTPGAAVRYTIDGSQPTASSTLYTAPISVTRTTTIRAIAVATGMAESTVASATYTLQAATPTFNPPDGTYLLPQFVSISSASPGVTIYYTTNGSTPTTSSTRYTGSLLVGIGTTTVRAIAVAPGWSPSGIASATYRIPF